MPATTSASACRTRLGERHAVPHGTNFQRLHDPHPHLHLLVERLDGPDFMRRTYTIYIESPLATQSRHMPPPIRSMRQRIRPLSHSLYRLNEPRYRLKTKNMPTVAVSCLCGSKDRSTWCTVASSLHLEKLGYLAICGLRLAKVRVIIT